MTTHRRALSPMSPRVVLEGPRSTAPMLTSTFENRFDPSRPIRASFSTVPSSSSSARNNSVYETQPVSKRTYVDGGGTVSRTEYAVRERRDSAAADPRRPLTVLTKNNVSPTRDHYTESPRDMVPYKPHTKDDTSSRLLQPTQQRGSAHHQRHNSATRAETGRYFGAAAPAAPAPRVERSYHSRGPYVEKVADSRTNLPRYTEEPAVEYTGPREQFDRDYPTATRSRRESLGRRERPGSAFEPRNEAYRRETAPPSSSRQLARVERDDRKSGFESDPDKSRNSTKVRRPSRGPVLHQRDEGYSSSRDDYDSRRVPNKYAVTDDIAPESARSRYRDSERDTERELERHRPDIDRDRERERERERPRRAEREEEIPSDRDRDRDRREKRPERPREREWERERERERDRDRDRDRERERERDRDRPYHKDHEAIEEDEPRRRHKRKDNRDSRDPSPDHSGLKALATVAVGGLAAAGIANHKSGKEKEEERSDSEKQRERRHRRRKSRDPRDVEKSNGEDEESRRYRKERRSQKDEQGDSSGSDTPDDESTRKRPRSRTRQRRDTQDSTTDREKPAQLALPAPEMERKPSREPETGTTREAPVSNFAPERKQDSPVNKEGRTMSPGEGEDGRPRRVSIVEPVREKKDDVKPRGILKKPREVPFPEDPNPQREGVAPLKQAGKEGIPPGARWTKVSRILVNPEALERSHLRFEEREDYVIVLKVLSREEIEKLAERTREIRGKRLSSLDTLDNVTDEHRTTGT